MPIPVHKAILLHTLRVQAPSTSYQRPAALTPGVDALRAARLDVFASLKAASLFPRFRGLGFGGVGFLDLRFRVSGATDWCNRSTLFLLVIVFKFGVSLSKLNIRKKGTFVIHGLLGSRVRSLNPEPGTKRLIPTCRLT